MRRVNESMQRKTEADAPDNAPHQVRVPRTMGARNRMRAMRMPANPANPGTDSRHSTSRRGIRIRGIPRSSRTNYVLSRDEERICSL